MASLALLATYSSALYALPSTAALIDLARSTGLLTRDLREQGPGPETNVMKFTFGFRGWVFVGDPFGGGKIVMEIPSSLCYHCKMGIVQFLFLE